MNRSENDFIFTEGKYKDQWMTDVEDIQFLKDYFINKIDNTNKYYRQIKNRIIYLEYLNEKDDDEYCENCSC